MGTDGVRQTWVHSQGQGLILGGTGWVRVGGHGWDQSDGSSVGSGSGAGQVGAQGGGRQW